MISRLRGEIVQVKPGFLVLDAGGVGYLVAVKSLNSSGLGDEITLYTHLAVRETAMNLYGFAEQEELEIFELLLKLPKIGPKSAMQIMSQADISLLKKAVISNDPTYLSKMSGIGKKSAEKIVAGLKDIFESDGTEMLNTENTEDGDVVDALISLGYSQKDARDALAKLSPEVVGTNERIKEALKLVN